MEGETNINVVDEAEEVENNKSAAYSSIPVHLMYLLMHFSSLNLL